MLYLLVITILPVLYSPQVYLVLGFANSKGTYVLLEHSLNETIEQGKNRIDVSIELFGCTTSPRVTTQNGVGDSLSKCSMVEDVCTRWQASWFVSFHIHPLITQLDRLSINRTCS